MGTMFTSKKSLSFPYEVGLMTGTNGVVTPFNVYYGFNGSPVSIGGLFKTTTSYRSGRTAEGSLTNEQILQQAQFEARKTLFPYDTGHPFQSESYEVFNSPKIFDIQGLGGRRWRGNVSLRCHANDAFSDPLPLGDLNVLGAQAINATVPTKPSVSIAEILAQLKQGQELPKLAGISAPIYSSLSTELFSANNLKEVIGTFLRKGGKSYLELEFGWAPFVNDIKKVANAVINSQKTVTQLVRDSGRPVRRRFRFPEVRTTSTVLDNVPVGTVQNTIQVYNFIQGIGSFSTLWGSPLGNLTCVKSTRIQRWFSGEYMYYLPEHETLLGKFQYYAELAEKLLGLEFTPSALWEVTPWSWLADWFADFSTVISNGTLFSDPDTNVVLRYGYMMESIDYSVATVITGAKIGANFLGNLSTVHHHTMKRRVQATPYGFGLNTASFTPYQWAILASLGLSSGASSLHSH